MNFLLSNIEVALEERFLLVGEKLLEDGKVNEFIESERNLWLTKVDDFEVELQISPSRVKAVSCECDIYLKEKMCGHIAAGLFGLRKQLAEKKKQLPKAQRKKPRVYHKLTTSSILENIKPEELKAFVAKYAKQNRNFALALGTRFASAVPLSDNHAKYEHLLHQSIQNIRKKDNKIGKTGVRQFLKFTTELSNQSKDALALENYTETWAIVSSIIPTLPLILRNIEEGHDEVLSVADDMFSQYDLINESSLAPDLKSAIWEFTITEFPKKSYRINDLATFFIQRVYTLADDEEKKNELFDIIFENWKYRNLLSEHHNSSIIICLLKLIEQPSIKDKRKTFEQLLLKSFSDFRLAFTAALEHNKIEFGASLLNQAKDVFNKNLYLEEIENMEFSLAIKKEDSKQINSVGEKLFIRSENMEVYKKLKSYNNGQWQKKRNQIISKIKSENKKGNSEILAKIYAEENLFDDLLDYLLNSDSLELAMKYDAHFLPEKKDELQILYRSLLDNYFSQHFGEKPSKYLLKILNHLRKINGEDVIDNIVQFIRKKYPRRMELAIEMMGLQ